MKNSLRSVSDKIMLRKRALIESVNDELKNIAQIEHSRHRSFANFVSNALSVIAAYCFFPKKPSISLEFFTDNQLILFRLLISNSRYNKVRATHKSRPDFIIKQTLKICRRRKAINLKNMKIILNYFLTNSFFIYLCSRRLLCILNR